METLFAMISKLKLLSVAQTASAVISILTVVISIFLVFVDGVAIIFSYVSLVFALLSINRNNIKLVKLFGILFLVPYAILAYSLYTDSGQSIGSSKLPDFELFEKCSNEMFQNKSDLKQPISRSENEVFTACLEAGKK